ncbi:UDP-N-acetylglucosamine transferase [Ruminiclostridium hungatei]|uniref:UDP-N-acetylglucosamine--N-acetylmuramyl-(pentapeptide) pyrophosphoryl-undecaprenol N-acetylglucosamine transferase n=1 Tax=Ruminiclostridium hungatei TaxID=48256 RepID=A0A1V4SQS0_RUMHU|nr:undecaprenyldiphospho-muramoylpentapeptide beta-N-acetylglucosaminyltransferase [Ruminiclostridium hungatei]OPX46248.1 UDP-N-acetylglucosamine transferase [Ruminiclostridium hungatei]
MKVLIAGGGTGGHINPGLAIAKHIMKKNPSAEITFVGTKKGLETKLVPREGFTLETITVRGFKRKLSLDTVLALKELAQSFFQASRLIKKVRPDVVIGTGGYVCGPVLYVAAKKGIPTLIHESNAFPGVTNRLLERYVNYVAISFKDAEKYFKNKEKLVHTGNPVRQELMNTNREAVLKKLDIVEGKPLLVAMGGSRGARKINETVVEMLNTRFKGEFNLIFATGEAQFNDINLSVCLDEKYKKMVKVVPYIYEVGQVYAASDLMICRAGAITISELQTMGIPSLLIPSPYVTANHQEHNARSLEKDGGAVVILENELNADILYNSIIKLISNRDVLNRMAADATKNRIIDSGEKIYSLVENMCK